jgi:hypothetical protein
LGVVWGGYGGAVGLRAVGGMDIGHVRHVVRSMCLRERERERERKRERERERERHVVVRGRETARERHVVRIVCLGRHSRKSAA